MSEVPFTPVKFGCLGCGTHVQKIMLKAFQDIRLGELYAIGTTSPEKISDLNSSFPTLKVFSNYESVLEDPSVEVVYIALPNHLHEIWSKKALLAGKHVLCEKPLFLEAKGANHLVNLADTSKLLLREAFMYRFHPQHNEVKRLLREGAIGTIRLFEAHCHYFLDDLSNIRLRQDAGGGGLSDVGCYTIDSARFYLEQEPLRVSGSWVIGEESNVDEFASIQLSFPTGVVANLICGTKLPRASYITIYGTLGKIHVEHAYNIPRTKPGRISLEQIGEKSQPLVIPPANQFVLELECMAEIVRNRSSANSPLENGLGNIKVLDAARRAANSNLTIEID